MRPVGFYNGLDYSIGGVTYVNSALLARDASDFQKVEAKKRQEKIALNTLTSKRDLLQ
jgi:hypothetical protein